MSEPLCFVCSWLDAREVDARKKNTPLHPVLEARNNHRQIYHPKYPKEKENV